MPTPYALSSDLVSAWPAKSLAVAQYVDGYKLDTGPVQNAQTGTSYTFLLTDTTKTVTANNSAASAYTIPPQSSVVWEAYTVLRLVNLGAGVVTLTGTVTVPQYGSVTIMRTASNAWTISGTSDAPGMVLITPTSVAGSGVTLSGGQVSFSAAASVSVNGCFTSAYANYLIIVNVTAIAAGSEAVSFRGRVSGTDRTDTYYGGTLTLAHSGTALTGANLNAVTSVRLGAVSVSSSVNTLNASITVCSPQLAQRTTLTWASPGYNGSAFVYENGGVMEFSTATQLDGFSIFPGASTISGILRVYGLRNS